MNQLFENLSRARQAHIAEVILPDLGEAAYRAYDQRQLPDVANLRACHRVMVKEIRLAVNWHYFGKDHSGNYVGMYIGYMANEIKSNKKYSWILKQIYENHEAFIQYLTDVGTKILVGLFEKHLPQYTYRELLDLLTTEN